MAGCLVSTWRVIGVYNDLAPTGVVTDDLDCSLFKIDSVAATSSSPASMIGFPSTSVRIILKFTLLISESCVMRSSELCLITSI